MARRKSVSAQGLMTLMIIILIAIVGLVAWVIIEPTGTDVTPSGGQPVDGASCPDSLATDFEADCLNQLNASGSDYLGCALKAVPDNDFTQTKSYTCDTDSSRTSSVDLKCGHSYVIYGTATQDSVNSFEPVSIGVVEGLISPEVFQGTEFSSLKAKAYDNLNKAFLYDSADASNSDYENVAVTFKSTTDNATATAMGIGDLEDVTFIVQTQGSVGQFGNKDVGVYVAVDADKTDYDEPTLYFDGSLLTDIKGSGEMSSDDEATLSSYEYIFKIPDNIKNQPRNVRMVLQGKAGVNPDVDVVLRFVAKGYYVGVDGVTIYKDAFNRASASQIATATAQTLTWDIS